MDAQGHGWFCTPAAWAAAAVGRGRWLRGRTLGRVASPGAWFRRWAAGCGHADRAGQWLPARAAHIYRAKYAAAAGERGNHRRHDRRAAGPPRQSARAARRAGVYGAFVIATNDQGRMTN